MSEKNLWTTVRARMIPDYWDQATRHEDAYQKGIADVSFVTKDGFHGWMELKWLAVWPKRATTIVRLPHYIDEQRQFLLEKGRAGGMSFLLLKAEDDYLIFNHNAAQWVGLLTRLELVNIADGLMSRRFDPELVNQVIRNNPGKPE